MKNRELASDILKIAIVPSMLLLAEGDFTPLKAKENNLQIALELARSSKIDKTIERVNTIYDYINLYILQTGDKAVTRDKLDDAFGLTNSNWLGYDNKIITFSINNNIVTFKNIIDKNTISESLKRFYKNSPQIHPLGNVNDDLSISTALDPKTVRLISTIDALDKTKTIISNTTPSTCDISKTWYKPTGSGDFKTYSCQNGKWQEVGSANSKIVVDSKDKLKTLSVKKGTTAYVSDKDGVAKEYIYDGKKWTLAGGGASSSEKKIVEYFSDVKDPKKGQTVYKKSGDSLIEYTYDGESWLRVTPTGGGGSGEIYQNKNAGTKYDGYSDLANVLNKLFNSESGSKAIVKAPGGEWKGEITFTKIDDVRTGGFWHTTVYSHTNRGRQSCGWFYNSGYRCWSTTTSIYRHVLIIKSIRDIATIEQNYADMIIKGSNKSDKFIVVFPDKVEGYYIFDKSTGYLSHYNEKNNLIASTNGNNFSYIKEIFQKNFAKILSPIKVTFPNLSDYSKFFSTRSPNFYLSYDSGKKITYAKADSSSIKAAWSYRVYDRWRWWNPWGTAYVKPSIYLIQDREHTPTPSKKSIYISLTNDCTSDSCENPNSTLTRVINNQLNVFRYTKYYKKAKNHFADYSAPYAFIHNGKKINFGDDSFKMSYYSNTNSWWGTNERYKKILLTNSQTDVAFDDLTVNKECKRADSSYQCRLYSNLNLKFSNLNPNTNNAIFSSKTIKLDTGFVQEDPSFDPNRTFKTMPSFYQIITNSDRSIVSRAYDKFRAMFLGRYNSLIKEVKTYTKDKGYNESGFDYGNEKNNNNVYMLISEKESKKTNRIVGQNYCWWTYLGTRCTNPRQSYTTTYQLDPYWEREN
jgi:hypothetical protein